MSKVRTSSRRWLGVSAIAALVLGGAVYWRLQAPAEVVPASPAKHSLAQNPPEIPPVHEVASEAPEEPVVESVPADEHVYDDDGHEMQEPSPKTATVPVDPADPSKGMKEVPVIDERPEPEAPMTREEKRTRMVRAIEMVDEAMTRTKALAESEDPQVRHDAEVRLKRLEAVRKKREAELAAL